ncbi:MAG: sulfotransferase family protein [Myxococcota bacterium]
MSRGVAILGMHRSGTSALSGSLRDAGLYLGGVLDRSIEGNQKGLQEAPSVLFMHEDLLRVNGGSWHEPPEAIEWQALHESVRDLFIESRRAHSPWGFKDPRTLLVFDGWSRALPELQAVGIFRHPAEVAASLHARNEFPIEKGLALWEHYNLRLFALQDHLEFPLLEFVDDGARMRTALQRAAEALELDPEGAVRFFESGLRRASPPELNLPESVSELYHALRERAQ